MDTHADAGGLGVKMYDGTGHFLPESKRGFPSPMAAFAKMSGMAKIFPKSRLFGQYHLTYLDHNQTHEVDVLSGAFLLLRRCVLEKTGLLDEAYFMYGEDIDLSYRIKKAGYKNYYFADTSIIHFKGESTKKGSLNYVRVFYNAMLIFAGKHVSGTNGKTAHPIVTYRHLHPSLFCRSATTARENRCTGSGYDFNHCESVCITAYMGELYPGTGSRYFPSHIFLYKHSDSMWQPGFLPCG